MANYGQTPHAPAPSQQASTAILHDIRYGRVGQDRRRLDPYVARVHDRWVAHTSHPNTPERVGFSRRLVPILQAGACRFRRDVVRNHKRMSKEVRSPSFVRAAPIVILCDGNQPW